MSVVYGVLLHFQLNEFSMRQALLIFARYILFTKGIEKSCLGVLGHFKPRQSA